MAFYIVTGKLGSGKTLSMVGRIQDALWKGHRVATNLDIYPDKLLGANHKKGELWRVPDKPTGAELLALGYGNNSASNRDEDSFGHLVLDEGGTWLNSRTWNDKERDALLDWMRHARKWHWHVYLIIQHINSIDKQIRENFGEHVVVCRRTDRMKIPVLGIRLPKVHIGFVRYGVNVNDPLVERWIYRAKDLYSAYDTDQKFVDRDFEGAVKETYRLKLPGELPPKRVKTTGIQKLLRAMLRQPSAQPVAAVARPSKQWPPHIASLPADQRWKLAERFFPTSPWHPVQIDRSASADPA